MNAWLCGLDENEYASVSSILTFIGVEHSTSLTAFQLPDFVVLGEAVQSFELDEMLPIISLSHSMEVFGDYNVWLAPLPWRSQTLSSILKSIKQLHTFPQASGVNLNLHVRHLEALLIRQALASTQGVVSKAAQNLQIQRTTLIEKMRRYNIDKSEF
ncbi:MAG: helix-turn-helix domain-containing protein [Marinomonas sp.]|uniref:helix-turn-helix domain-containing protein n=1 Tax=unclassified Marinomonas TaxID=196814 RepID=UPI002934D142|nr:helix-turn-helix domain-containing protein [Marinomonas sp. GJ51-6]WOD06556.1 helix-turn-helix domain-containing protein [Marinomonas sp. GJ51-6]